MQIAVHNLEKSFRDADRTLTVISGLNAQFPSGKTVAVVGRSGVGKSTLLHLLGGLDRPSSGSIFLEGVDLAQLKGDALSSFRGRHIGFVFQFHHLLPDFSALENAAMPLLIEGVSEREAQSRAAEVLSEVGLSGRLDHRPGELSGGEQQRVAVARAVVSRPQLILADEPTGNLDLETARETQDILLRLSRGSGSTLIVATHSRELAASMDMAFEMLPGGSWRWCRHEEQ